MTEEEKTDLERAIDELPVWYETDGYKVISGPSGPSILDTEGKTLSVFWLLASGEDSGMPKKAREDLLREYVERTWPAIVLAMAENEKPEVKGVSLSQMYEALLKCYGILANAEGLDLADSIARAVDFLDPLLSDEEKDEGLRLAYGADEEE